jgi:hypothetical protein
MTTMGKLVITAVVAASLAVAAPALAAPKATDVKAKLFEFKIKLKPKAPAPGSVRIVARNIGTEKHEIVIVRGADAAALPTKADGSVDEALIPETDKLGEIPEFKPKQTKKKTFELESGSYVAFCNVVDDEPDGSTLSHFAQGMYTTFTVG